MSFVEKQFSDRLLEEIQSPASEKYLPSLLKDKEKSVRIAAAKALINLGIFSFKSLLLNKCLDRDVRLEVLKFVQKKYTKTELESLCTLMTDKDKYIRIAAARVLIKERAALESFLLPFLSDNDEGIRKKAIIAISEVGTPNVARLLLPLLVDEDAGVRNAATGALICHASHGIGHTS